MLNDIRKSLPTYSPFSPAIKSSEGGREKDEREEKKISIFESSRVKLD